MTRHAFGVEKLLFAWGAADGWPQIDHDHLEDAPVVTVTLNEIGDKTEMIFHLTLPDDLADDRVREWFASGMREGWTDTLGRLVTRFAGVATTN